jgi:hypothetical protein
MAFRLEHVDGVTVVVKDPEAAYPDQVECGGPVRHVIARCFSPTEVDLSLARGWSYADRKSFNQGTITETLECGHRLRWVLREKSDWICKLERTCRVCKAEKITSTPMPTAR